MYRRQTTNRRLHRHLSPSPAPQRGSVERLLAIERSRTRRNARSHFGYAGASYAKEFANMNSLEAGSYAFGPGDGQLLVRVFREGVAARMGHDLAFEVRDWS